MHYIHDTSAHVMVMKMNTCIDCFWIFVPMLKDNMCVCFCVGSLTWSLNWGGVVGGDYFVFHYMGWHLPMLTTFMNIVIQTHKMTTSIDRIIWFQIIIYSFLTNWSLSFSLVKYISHTWKLCCISYSWYGQMITTWINLLIIIETLS